MSDLRGLLESLGYEDVRTHLQSGNAIFKTSRDKASTLETQIEKAIVSEIGMDVKVLVRSSRELASVVENNPFLKHEKVANQELHAAFLSSAPPPQSVSTVDRKGLLPNEFEVGDRVLYLRMPNGIAAAKMPNWERVLGVTVTQRNWNTVSRLYDLSLRV